MTSPSLPNLGPTTDHSIDSARERLHQCANAGFFRHAVNEAYGGTGGSFSNLAVAHRQLGEQTRDPGLMLAINAHLWGTVFAIQRFGDDAQKSKWIPGLLDGTSIGGHAITEPQAGSNTAALETTFRLNGDELVLNGHKRFITNTPIADLLVIYARDETANRLSAFIVQPSDTGADFQSGPTVEGCATATMGDVLLSDCHLPASRQLGKTGAGGTMIQLALELERAFIFAGVAGVMAWQLQTVIDYAKQRDAAGGKLARHQAISHTIAEMKLRLDTTQLWIDHCAALLDAGKRITVPGAETKLHASEAFLQSSLEAVQIHGASGLSHELTDLVQDAMAGRLMSGSSEIQKNIIGAMLGLPAS